MRHGLASALAALSLSACGGSPAEPAPVTPAPVPEPEEERPAPEASAEAEPGAPSPAEVQVMEALARLIGEPPVAFYLPRDRSALVARAADGEVAAILLDADGRAEPLARWTAKAGGPAAIARPVATGLAGAPMVEMTYTAWPAGKDRLRLTRPALTVIWRRGRLSARVGKKSLAVGPAPARPAGVFASPASPAVLVLIRRDPGASTEVLRFDRPGAGG
jgi:hypothetical protein